MSMTREEAMRAQLGGAKITHSNWGKDYYIYIDFNAVHPSRDSTGSRCDYLPFKDGYEIYKKEKVKRKIVRWVNIYEDKETFYCSEKYARLNAVSDALAVAVRMEVEIEVEVDDE